MWELLVAGGKAMIPIGIAAVLTLAIVLERFWSLRRKEILPPNLPGEVRNWAQHRRLDDEHLKALADTSPLGSVFAAALRARHLGREAIKERVEDAGRHVMHDMEKFLNTLGTIALISPLLGLLGTVIGLIRMFLSILNSGIGDANQMAGGIGEALVCTAAGLCVAIPAYVFHRHLRAKVAGLGIALEKEVVALIDVIEAEVPVQVAAARRAAK
ncbi:MAG: MotA/TolQ/ExbB proton channel family protein [Xanthomonadales bacterium]|nr:MotA/TolQ/ExbB proton channel family protein [Xanthomonadales bacterium]MBP6078664.1 MotA/TolQ/ExbB proton channel family protein [Xanthomonadales bacterium]MBP7624199.1 MotA/TolQ/ExbB proton channel family protein [Xanthomonadales bacterium]